MTLKVCDWQSKSDLDRFRNSCDVFSYFFLLHCPPLPHHFWHSCPHTSKPNIGWFHILNWNRIFLIVVRQVSVFIRTRLPYWVKTTEKNYWNTRDWVILDPNCCPTCDVCVIFANSHGRRISHWSGSQSVGAPSHKNGNIWQRNI